MDEKEVDAFFGALGGRKPLDSDEESAYRLGRGLRRRLLRPDKSELETPPLDAEMAAKASELFDRLADRGYFREPSPAVAHPGNRSIRTVYESLLARVGLVRSALDWRLQALGAVAMTVVASVLLLPILYSGDEEEDQLRGQGVPMIVSQEPLITATALAGRLRSLGAEVTLVEVEPHVASLIVQVANGPTRDAVSAELGALGVHIPAGSQFTVHVAKPK